MNKEQKKERIQKEEKSEEEIALMFYELYYKINATTLDDKTKQSIKKNIADIQKALKVKQFTNSTVSLLKKLGVIKN